MRKLVKVCSINTVDSVEIQFDTYAHCNIETGRTKFNQTLDEDDNDPIRFTFIVRQPF